MDEKKYLDIQHGTTPFVAGNSEKWVLSTDPDYPIGDDHQCIVKDWKEKLEELRKEHEKKKNSAKDKVWLKFCVLIFEFIQIFKASKITLNLFLILIFCVLINLSLFNFYSFKKFDNQFF